MWHCGFIFAKLTPTTWNRDDGLALSDKNGIGTERLKKQITKIFSDNGLKITTSTNVKIVNFIDVTLNLNDGSYRPFSKPESKPI